MTGRPSGRCAAMYYALKDAQPWLLTSSGVYPHQRATLTQVHKDVRAALASPCCETTDQEQVKEALDKAMSEIAACDQWCGQSAHLRGAGGAL